MDLKRKEGEVEPEEGRHNRKDGELKQKGVGDGELERGEN